MSLLAGAFVVSTFRIVMTGEEHDERRVTWTLERSPTACALERIEETAPPLAGNHEADEGVWIEVARAKWSGRALDEGRLCMLGLVMRGGDLDWVDDEPDAVLLACVRAEAEVRPARTRVVESGRCEPAGFDTRAQKADVEECATLGRRDEHSWGWPATLTFGRDGVEYLSHQTTCGFGETLRWMGRRR